MSNRLQECLGAWIADYRLLNGLSRADLGDALGVGAEGVARLESGADIRLGTVESIAELLGVHPAEMLRPREGPTGPPVRGRSGTGGALTSREREVLRVLARGMRNREIAAELGISQATVKRHLANIFDRLQVHSRLQAIRVAEEWPERHMHGAASAR